MTKKEIPPVSYHHHTVRTARENRKYCRECGIRLSGPRLGRPCANAEVDKKQEYQDNTDRIKVGHSFSLGKRCYGMGYIVTKLEETQLASVALSVFVMNLFKIQKRMLCAFLYLFQFLHKWDKDGGTYDSMLNQ